MPNNQAQPEEEDDMRSRHNVRHFSDFRAFLLAHVQEQRLANLRWNLELWSRLLGLKSSSALLLFLTGEKIPSPSLVQKFVCYFAFDMGEADYFRSLITLLKFKDNLRTRSSILQRVQRTNPHSAAGQLSDEHFLLATDWYTEVICNLNKGTSLLDTSPTFLKKLLFPFESMDFEKKKLRNAQTQLPAQLDALEFDSMPTAG